MGDPTRARVVLPALLLIGAGVFLTGISWGLPSRSADALLFGQRSPWTGSDIERLAGPREESPMGADVDRDPVQRQGGIPVVLNDTDEKRARIIRRYRLFTCQPDEMITLMSLASMRPAAGDLDPKLYQYGGLWIYPVGAMLKLADLIGYIDLGKPAAHFLDHPEQFARFYIVARLYAALWGLAGIFAVFALARTAQAGLLGAASAALLYTFLPVVVNMSHEAKPHLPGAVLILLASIAAGKFVLFGRARWWILTGMLCGAAMGMILSGALVFAVIPAMLLLRPMRWKHRAWIATATLSIGIVVYFATNPYVMIHLLGDGAVLQSNLGNSQAMYQVRQIGSGLLNAAKLIAEGATPLVAIVGLIGVAVLWRGSSQPLTAGLRCLTVVALFVVLQFVLLAAGKPAEYGRFAITAHIALALCAAVLVGRARIRRFEKLESFALLILLTILPSIIYLYGFVRDSGSYPRRLHDAALLSGLHRAGARTIGVFDEPAPYLLPPVDLFEWTIVLLPREYAIDSATPLTDVIVRPVDRLGRAPQTQGAYVLLTEQTFADLFPAKISWANKPIEIWVRSDLLR